MARKKAPPLDLSAELPPVRHLPVRSLPFNEAWLRAARDRWLQLKARGARQRDLAAWIGCVQGSISNILGAGGVKYYRTEYLERLSAALGLDLPLRAQFDIEGDEIGDDEIGLAKVIDLVRWTRKRIGGTGSS